ncbi:hypothetical protein QTP88_022480 [Uroleucon formosanum]
MSRKRKYDDSYIKYGFTEIEVNREIRPQCVICTVVLSNDALKPAKLLRHLHTIHPTLKDQPPEFFEGKCKSLKKMKLGPSGANVAVSQQVLTASFEISQLISKSKKAHSIGETLIKPSLLIAANIFGEDAKKKIQNMPLSNNTVKARIEKMSCDIEEQLLGCRSGLATLVKEKNPSTLMTHCVIHRQALATKTLPEELANVLKLAIKLVNFVKSKALNTRIFKKLCVELDSEYDTLLFHTEVRWLSKGNMLKRLYELKEEMKLFLNEKDSELLEKFCDLKFELQFAYLVDIFEHLNHLNLQLQGSGHKTLEFRANIFIFEDKIRAFVCKINLWMNKIENNNYSAFQTFQTLINDDQYADILIEIQHNIKKHLEKLKSEFIRYFPEWNEVNSVQKIIRNPFCAKVEEAPEYLQEAVIELQNDSDCKNMFDSGMNLEEFWCRRATLHIQLREIALRYLVVFSTTYLCEQGFSSPLVVKNKQRNRLDVSDDMRLAISKIHPRIEKLVKEIQPQKSH